MIDAETAARFHLEPPAPPPEDAADVSANVERPGRSRCLQLAKGVALAALALAGMGVMLLVALGAVFVILLVSGV